MMRLNANGKTEYNVNFVMNTFGDNEIDYCTIQKIFSFKTNARDFKAALKRAFKNHKYSLGIRMKFLDQYDMMEVRIASNNKPIYLVTVANFGY